MYQSKFTGTLHRGPPPPPRRFAGMPPEFAIQSTRPRQAEPLRTPDEVVSDPNTNALVERLRGGCPACGFVWPKIAATGIGVQGRRVPGGAVTIVCHNCYKRTLVEVHGAARWIDPLREPGRHEAAIVRQIHADITDHISLGLFGDGRVEMVAAAWPRITVVYYCRS